MERIDLIYRPDNLAGETVDAVAKLRWQFALEGGSHRLRETNPSAYYIAFTSIKVSSGDKVFELGKREMLVPNVGPGLLYDLKVLGGGTAECGVFRNQ